MRRTIHWLSMADKLGRTASEMRKAGGVAGRQDGPMVRSLHAVEKVDNLCGAEHDGQRLWRFRRGQHGLHRPRLLECHGVEEAERRHGDDERAGGQVFLSLAKIEDRRLVAHMNGLVSTVAAMGLMGLGLAIVGLHGLVAYAASRRTREIGMAARC